MEFDYARLIIQCILAFTAEHGYPPSFREIGTAVGLTSSSHVHYHLQKLRLAGRITYEPGKNRTIRVLTEAGK